MISGYRIDQIIKNKIKNELYSFHTKPLDFEIIKKFHLTNLFN